MVKWCHHTASPDLHVLGDRSHGGARDRRVGVQATERVEVTLGRPYRGEAVLVGKARPIQQKLIPVTGATAVVGEIEETELHATPPVRLALSLAILFHQQKIF